MGLSERSGFIGTSAPLRSREIARRVDAYRAHLRGLHDWEAYLKAHSGLPGPSANLELVEAVGDEAESNISKTRMKALGAAWVTESLAGVSASTPARKPANKKPRA
jgi:hypothetical protein